MKKKKNIKAIIIASLLSLAIIVIVYSLLYSISMSHRNDDTTIAGGFASNSDVMEISSNSGNVKDYTQSDYTTAEIAPELPDVVSVSDDKLIYSASARLESREFTESVAYLKEAIQYMNGVIQSERYYNNEPYDYEINRHDKIGGYKRFETIVRIPTEKFNEFIDSLEGIGHIKSIETELSNITQEYNRTQIYLESYQKQLEQLQSLYSKAESISEILDIEERISEVQARIASESNSMQSMNTDTAYSNVAISISEVAEYSENWKKYSELGFLEKLGNRFVESWHGFLIIMENLLYLLIDLIWFIIIIAVIVVIIMFRRKRKKGIANKVPTEKIDDSVDIDKYQQ